MLAALGGAWPTRRAPLVTPTLHPSIPLPHLLSACSLHGALPPPPCFLSSPTLQFNPAQIRSQLEDGLPPPSALQAGANSFHECATSAPHAAHLQYSTVPLSSSQRPSSARRCVGTALHQHPDPCHQEAQALCSTATYCAKAGNMEWDGRTRGEGEEDKAGLRQALGRACNEVAFPHEHDLRLSSSHMRGKSHYYLSFAFDFSIKRVQVVQMGRAGHGHVGRAPHLLSPTNRQSVHDHHSMHSTEGMWLPRTLPSPAPFESGSGSPQPRLQSR